MKFSNRQAELLAQKVFEKLKAEDFKVSPAKRKEIDRYVKTHEKLRAAYDAANQALTNHSKILEKITGLDRFYGGTSAANIIKEMEKRYMPSLRAIEDEIIVNSMFENGDNLEAFLDKIARKFRPRQRPVKQPA